MKILKYILFAFIVNCSTIIIPLAQNNPIWIVNQNINGGGNTIGMKTDAEGNIYVTGEGTGTYLTTKYNNNGSIIWMGTISGTFTDGAPASMDMDGDNVYVTGSVLYPTTGSDYFTVKYDKNGNHKWSKVYRRTSSNNPHDVAARVKVDHFGNVFVTGLAPGLATYADLATVKYDSTGNQLWVAIYDSSSQVERATDLALDEDGNAYVIGVTSEIIESTYHVFLIKYNQNGIKQWVNEIRDVETHAPYYFAGTDSRVIVDSKGNIIIIFAGTIGSIGYDYYVIKFGPSGNKIWDRIYNLTARDMPTALQLDKFDNIYVTGVKNHATSNSGILTLKYDSSGNIQWNNVINNFNPCFAYDMSIDSFYNVCIATSFGINRINSSGNFMWSNSAIDGRCITLDTAGFIYMASSVYHTAKYGPGIVSVINISNGIPAKYYLHQNYPNPFNPQTIIKYDMTKDAFITIKIYDVLGREVLSVNEFKKAGQYEVKFDGTNFVSGIYFYSFEANGFKDTKKMVLIK